MAALYGSHGQNDEKYVPEFCEEVIELAKEGKLISGICVAFDCSRQTLTNWRKRYPEFNEAYIKAEEAAQAYYEEQQRKALTGETEKFPQAANTLVMTRRFKHDYASEDERAAQAKREMFDELRTRVTEIEDEEAECLEVDESQTSKSS